MNTTSGRPRALIGGSARELAHTDEVALLTGATFTGAISAPGITSTSSIVQSGGNVSLGAQSSGAVSIGNTGGTSSLTLDAGSGTISIGASASARTTDICTGAADQTISIGTGAANNLIAIGSQVGSSGTTIAAGTSGLNLYAAGTGTTTIGTTSNSGKISIGNDSNDSSQTITVGYTNTYGPSSTTTTIYIGTGGSGYSKNSVKIGNYGSTSASDTTIYGDTIVMGTSGTTTVTIGSTSSTSSTSLQSGTGKITLNNAEVGKWTTTTTYAVFKHEDCLDTDYALIQNSSGRTLLNGNTIEVRCGNNSTERIFINSTGIGFFGSSPVAKQTGGVATADLTYSSTERDMINKMYAALRNYGLLT
jgi:hypothetical protein